MSSDPYSSPAPQVQPPAISSSVEVTQGVLAQLAGTKPWVRFMAVLMFIGTGFMLLAGIFMLLAGGAMAAVGNSQMGPIPGGILVGMSVLYLVLAALYIYPAIKLWKYADRIATLLNSKSVTDLEGALGHQRSFWKFVGIMVIAIFALYIVAFIVLFAVGGFAAMKMQGT